ncbi:MAG: SDR family NAD(P)-dependent oxidoreductase, partial [Gaiellaceae bacterium]
MAIEEKRAWAAYVNAPLAGLTAVVTGAAKGLGGAITDVLACDGANVALAGRDRDALEAHARYLDGEYPERESFAVVCNVTEASEVDGLMEAAAERFGGIDILVNTAGVIGPIETPAQ